VTPAFVFRTQDRVHFVRRRLSSATLSRTVEPVEITRNPALLGGSGPADTTRRYAAGPIDVYLALDFSDPRVAVDLASTLGDQTPFALVLPHEVQYEGIARVMGTRPDYAILRCSEIIIRRSRFVGAEGPSSSLPLYDGPSASTRESTE
jgi:hypothetical protein